MEVAVRIAATAASIGIASIIAAASNVAACSISRYFNRSARVRVIVSRARI